MALDEFHSSGLSHNDIRLPNICFNKDYEAVLIDVDMYHDIKLLHPYFGGKPFSILYKTHGALSLSMPIGRATDLAQLGLMVAWILDPALWRRACKRVGETEE